MHDAGSERTAVWARCGAAVWLFLAWLIAGPAAKADNTVYVPAYNALAGNLNLRTPYCSGLNALSGKAPLDTVTQADLQGLRNYVRQMMINNFLFTPNTDGLPFETLPGGLQYSGGVLVTPSLMDGIGDGQGRFTKIPAEYTRSGQALYAESFTDAPVLWIHFAELYKAMSRLRYVPVLPGANVSWTANGEANEHRAYGAALTSTQAVAGCEANYAINPPTVSEAGPGAVASIIAPIGPGYGWQAAVVRRYAYLKLSGLSTSIAHRAWFYAKGTRVASAPHFQTEYDNNGTPCEEGRWRLWSMVDGGYAATVLSSAFGGDGAMPVWCSTPQITPGWNEEGWRGYGCAVLTVMDWDFPDREPKQPCLQDPEEDGLSDTGCGCSSCPIETAAVWDGLQPQAKVLIPLGVSDGLLSGGLRVKSYLTEYTINGATQQMLSVGSGVLWTAGADSNDWQFVCVRRPSGDEVVFAATGAAAGRPVNAARNYRMEKVGSLVKVRFPGKGREVVHEFSNNLLTAVSVKTGRKELRTELVAGQFPGMSGVAEFVGVWRMKQVNSSLVEARMGYVNDLVRSVEYRYRSGGPTNTLVYYSGSKGFRNLDANGRITWDTRVVTDTNNGAVEIWSGITTNGGLRVARKQRRRAWYDTEQELSMVEETEVARAGGSPEQTCTTLLAVAAFPWGDEKVSGTVGAGSPEARTTRYTYCTNSADLNQYGRLVTVESPDGAWTRLEYDSLGRERRILSGFKQARVGDTNACRATENFYAGDPVLGPLNMPAADLVVTNDGCPRLIVERLAGQEVARTYHSYQPDRETVVRAAQSGAAYDDPGNLVTVTTHVTSGNFKGRPLRTDHPGGQFSVFAYSYDAGRKELTVTENSGTGTGGVVTNGTRTVTVTDVAQRTLRVTTVDIASGIELTGTANTLDWLGRVVCASNRVDGTVTRNQYGCCGLEETRDADGVSTGYVYDELKRVYASERLGVTTFNSYDVFGNVVKTRRTANGYPDVVTASQYDQVGRLMRTVNERGFATTWSYATNAAGEATVTTVLPDGSFQVETSYPDGQPKSVTGTAVRARCYDYGVDEQGIYTTTYEGADTNAAQWVRTYSDRLGRLYLTVYPDGYRVETRYDQAGRVVCVTDGLMKRLTAYNAQGEAFRSAVDMNGNSDIDLTGEDRVSETGSRAELFQGKPAWKNEQQVYASSGNGVSTPVGQSWRSVDGAVAWSVSFGRTSRTDRVRFPESAAAMETVLAPDGTRSVSWFTNGLLKNVQRQSVGGQVVAERGAVHDEFGRLVEQTETGPGGNEIRTIYRHDASGNVTSQVVMAGGLTRATSHDYDVMGRRVRTVLPDGGVVAADYEPTGELRGQSGARTYPVRYAYDERGRLAALETFRRGTNEAPDVTRWDYDARRGWLTAKIHADGSTNRYEYRPDGQLAKRVWARGVETLYRYDAAGSLTNVAYSDGTPAVVMTLDRVGRRAVVGDGTGGRTNVYGVDGTLIREVLPGSAGELRFDYDAWGRRTNLQVRGVSGDTVYRTAYRYDDAGRLLNVSAGGLTTRYSYGGDGQTVTGLVMAAGATDRFRGTRQYDALGRLQRVGWERGTEPVASVEYGHDASDRRTRRTAADGSYWAYGYDEWGQVVTGQKFGADGEPVTDAQFSYNYDLIGNRNWATDGAGRRLTYSVNELNQYTNMSLPGLVRDTVWSGTVYTFGGRTGSGMSLGLMLRQVQPRYDADGNLTDDGRFTYGWDGENRLVLVSNLQSRLVFIYDYLSRRVRKSVFAKTSDSWLLTSDSFFAYDGWNLISETQVSGLSTQVSSYVWGLDVSGTLQGAGGIGGLLSASHGGTTSVSSFVYVHDGNGNVTDLLDTNGTRVAHYDYDPFGNLLSDLRSPTPDLGNPFRFSTKYVDQETGLSYYGYRYYSPTMGRWLSRDPLGESGGVNLVGFVGNSPENAADPLGLALYAFDGTGASEETWTHVSILHRSYLGTAWYKEGVGSRWYSSVVGGVTGLGGTVRLDDMYRLLVETYKNGDKDIDIIGFSRGASLAREFANMIYENGITDTIYRWERDNASGQYNRVVDSHDIIACSPKIRFVGLFDTVGSFGIPGNQVNIGIRMGLPPNVEHAAQAVAGDERRSQFRLTPLNDPSAGQDFSQQVFAGDHSDIGGGHEEQQNILAIDPLLYIWSRGRDAGVPFGSLNFGFDEDKLFLYVAGERRPWAYQMNTTPHDLTTLLRYTDGGVRKNLPGGLP